MVAEGPLALAPMRPMVRDLRGGDGTLRLGWLHASAYRPASGYDSRVLDAQQMVTWDRATWKAKLPAGTGLQVSVRTGSRPTPDGTWTAFAPLGGSGSVIGTEGRYLQYRVELTTTSAARTPVLSSIGFTHNGRLMTGERETG